MNDIQAYTIGNKVYQNGQRKSECQLVTVLNCAYYLGETFIYPYSNEYERLIDMVGARHGSAINIYRIYFFK